MRATPQLLGNVAELSAVGTPGVVTHEGIQPVFDIYVSAEGPRPRLASSATCEQIVEETHDGLPRSAVVHIKGQAELMASAYAELLVGLVAAVVLVYLLIVVNFQSWLDPFIIITALPGALAGHRVVAVRDPHEHLGARADRRDHVDGYGDSELDPGRRVRQGAARDAR